MLLGKVQLVHMSLDRRLEPVGEQHRDVLTAAILAGVDVSPCPNAERFIGYGDTLYGYGPACVVDVAGTEYVAEPHVTWFPWVGPKDMINNFKWAMAHLNKTKQVMLVTEKKGNSFFEHFVKRGVLRKVGHLKNIPLVDEVHFYQYGGIGNE